MFVGHYGVSFAAKRVAPTVPLWVLFIAVQLLDVFWAPFVLLGIEKVRIAPGITATLLFGGMWLYIGAAGVPRRGLIVFGLVMLAIQAYVFFGPPPVSDRAAAWTALVSYAVFAAIIARMERPIRASGGGAA
jgi:hypothetical protein